MAAEPGIRSSRRELGDRHGHELDDRRFPPAGIPISLLVGSIIVWAAVLVWPVSMMLLAGITVLAAALGLTIHILLKPRDHTAAIRGARKGAQAVRRLVLIVAVAVAIAAAFWLAWFLQHSRFMEIDRCLDAGGAWDYEQETCRTE